MAKKKKLSENITVESPQQLVVAGATDDTTPRKPLTAKEKAARELKRLLAIEKDMKHKAKVAKRRTKYVEKRNKLNRYRNRLVVAHRMLGRPTKYSDYTLHQAKKYFLTSYAKNKFPTIEELSLIIGVDSDTITNWCHSHEEFFGTIKKIKDWQKHYLLVRSLTAINPVAFIFQLKANHGMIERDRLELTGGGGQPLTIHHLVAMVSKKNKKELDAEKERLLRAESEEAEIVTDEPRTPNSTPVPTGAGGQQP